MLLVAGVWCWTVVVTRHHVLGTSLPAAELLRWWRLATCRSTGGAAAGPHEEWSREQPASHHRPVTWSVKHGPSIPHHIHVPSRARDEGEGWVLVLRVVGVRRKPERSVARALAHGLPTRHVPEGGGNRMTLVTTLPARAPATGHPSVAQPALCGKRVG